MLCYGSLNAHALCNRVPGEQQGLQQQLEAMGAIVASLEDALVTAHGSWQMVDPTVEPVRHDLPEAAHSMPMTRRTYVERHALQSAH